MASAPDYQVPDRFVQILIEHMDDRFDAMNENLDSLFGVRLKPIKADISRLKTDVSQLKGDVTVLKTDVSQLKGDVTVLKTDVAVLKSDVAELKTDAKVTRLAVTSIAKDHTSLLKRVSKIETQSI